MSSKFSIALLCVFLGLTVQSTFAQSPEWAKVVSSKGDFSVDIPATEWIVDRDDNTRTIYCGGSELSVTIFMRAAGSAKNEFRQQTRFFNERDGHKYFEVGDFLIRRYFGKPQSKDDEDDKKAYISLTFASSKGYYTVWISAPTRTDEFYQRILNSIRLNNQPFVKASTQYREADRMVAIDTLNPDHRVLAAIKRPDSKQESLYPGTEEEYSRKDKTVYSRSLIVLRRVKAQYTAKARNNRISGTVHLLVTFLASGEIGPIKLVRSLDKGLDKAAFEAARKIKFLPAEIDGKSADTVRPVVYSFSVY